MKLVQLNIWTGRITHLLEQFLRAEKPDILCLQEAIDLPKGDGVIFLTVKEIQEITGLKNLFFSPVFTFNYMNRVANFGNCIITSLPIEKAETIFTNEQFMEKLDIADREVNMRNFQHATLRTPDGTALNIINHHGYRIPEHKNGDEKSLRYCKMIADYSKTITDPLIITGDFNLVPESESMQQFEGVTTNLVTKAGLKTTRTPHTHKTEVCDYILVNDQVAVKHFEMSDAVVSDHAALVLEFGAQSNEN